MKGSLQAQDVLQDKNVQKQIERLNKGREEKERIKSFMERGGTIKTENYYPPNFNANESVMTQAKKKPDN